MDNSLALFDLSKDEVLANFLTLVPGALMVIVTTLAIIVFYKVTASIIEAALRQTAMQPGLIRITVHSLYKWTVGTIGLISVLGMVGINVSAALAGVGVVGIGIGFAAKETLANIMAGFGIFIDKLYKHGDWVNIGGQHGEVKDITLRTTKIRTLDNVFIMIPNSLVTSLPITNYSEEGMMRITIKVSLSFKESIDEARKVLLKAAKSLKGICKDPAPVVVIDEIDSSSLTLFVRIWIEDPGTEPAYRFKLTEACKKALDEASIDLPIPKQDIYIKEQKVNRIAR